MRSITFILLMLILETSAYKMLYSEEDLSNSLPDTPREYENQYKSFIPKTEKTASLVNNFEQTNIEQQLSSGQPDNTGKTNSTTNYICWKTSPESINQPVVPSKSDTCSDGNFGMETLSILNSYDEVETLDQVETSYCSERSFYKTSKK
ncbi:hypothetical protein Anas_01683 [Armadillidium nasatum]|uniref:Uncharacterized protein n=1 Tax=Armadillidium nasatum TaxID=96803 RepID=A0A5N5SKH8_9CRUS|nr:hypothetical protein Anas_01683 [Armadillidium nasatum]